MHLWSKGGNTRESLIRFTCDSDRRYDGRLALYDITGSMAHAVMLSKCGIISADEKKLLLRGLSELFEEAGRGDAVVGPEYEDIHSFVEFRLREYAGDVAGKLHAGRSRNDQVLTDIHLWLRHHSAMLAMDLYGIAGLFLDLSEKHRNDLMPGFSHLQPAMLSSFGLWFAAYAESLCDDICLLAGATAFAGASPLGTAAGYGTALPVDREYTALLLGFDRLIVASPYAQMSRGRNERIMTHAISSAANTLGKFSSDAVLFMSPGYAFLTMSDEFTTGSSIMPQKKNPDLFELIRARCNRLQAVPNEITMMTAGLPPGYNRDYQELKAILFDTFDSIGAILSVMPAALESLVVRNDIMKDQKYNVIFAVEEANRMVLEGIPFRDAYKSVSAKLGTASFRPTGTEDYTHTGSIGNPGIGLIRERLEKVMESFIGAFSPQELVRKILKEAEF